jgi:hypothetical protein
LNLHNAPLNLHNAPLNRRTALRTIGIDVVLEVGLEDRGGFLLIDKCN